jgi:serine/threonine protein kinase
MPPGTHIGPYVILGQVPGGIGGMAIVYRARLRRRGSTVALKVAHAGLGGFLKDETAFLKATDLNHPHIIKVMPTPLSGGASDYIVRDPETGSWYFAMAFMAGGSLADWLHRRRRLALSRSIQVMQQIGAALDAAHEAGIVHLDVKPSNILFRQRPEKAELHAVLTDFGIARPQGRAASGQTTLTIEYASPEQARVAQGDAIAVGPRSDLYSLGVIFYEMISGRLPFQAQNDLAMMHQVVYEDPPLPVPFGPPELNPIMERALAKDPEARYLSAEAFVSDLSELPREALEAPARQRQMQPLLSLGLGALIGLVLGVPAGYYLRPPEQVVVVTQVPVVETKVVVITATPTATDSVVDTPVPSVTPTTPSSEPTRPPTSTPVPATSTLPPRPPATATPEPEEPTSEP